MNLEKHETITIVGSKSFLGKNLNEEFIKSNYTVRFISSRLHKNTNKSFYYKGNDFDSIVNGKIILTGWPINADFETSKLWCDEIFRLLKIFLKKNEDNYLICIGSAAELNPSTDIYLKENDYTNGVGDYGRAKVYLLKKFLNDNEIRREQFSWIRLFAPTGKFESKSRLIPYATKLALRNEDIFCNNPNIFRDYSDIGEIVKSLKFIAQKKYGGIINLASGKKIMIKDLIYKIIQKTDSKSNLIIKDLYEEEWKRASWFANIDKLKLLVPEYPKIGISKIIDKHIQQIKAFNNI